MQASFSVYAIDSESRSLARDFAAKYAYAFSGDSGDAEFALEFSKSGLNLWDRRNKKPVRVQVDFVTGAAAHRMKYGGGKSQAIAKAVGVSVKMKPRVLDATAGLGKDAFVLAGLGCELLMLERSPIVHALLADGLRRARAWVETGNGYQIELLRDSLARMQLVAEDARGYMQELAEDSVNVVYLDPMFPERKKSAQVKKEMLAFQTLVGKDEDADTLLQNALRVAENRVVVKRPALAPYLADTEPGYQLKGKSSRFDIYTKKKFDL